MTADATGARDRILPRPRLPDGEPYRKKAARCPVAVRLDGNEGARPDAAGLLAALSQAPSEDLLRLYPDVSELERQVAARWDVAPERVLLTAGGDDLIDRACRGYLGEGRRLLLPVPGFEIFERYAELAGGAVEKVPWGDDGFPVDALLGRADDDVGLVPVVSPNNPTGAVATLADLRRLAEGLPHALVLLDHAYVEYADEDHTRAALELPNVVVLRTFSKAWGLAGCRVGYGLGDPDVLTVLRRAGAPFAVPAPSIALVRQRLTRGDDGLAEHVRRVRAERAELAAACARLGLRALPSQGNFTCLDTGAQTEWVHEALASVGVLVRRLVGGPGMPECLRVSLPGDEAGFAALLRALETVRAPQAVLLDMDGVIADVAHSQRACIRETAASFGVPLTAADVAAALMEGDANDDWVLTRRLLSRRGVEADLDDVTQRYQRLYLGEPGTDGGQRRHERLLVPREQLERLAARLPLAVVTGRPRAEAEWFIEREQLGSLLAAVTCREDAPLKPDPAPVRLTLERLGVERAFMVGDTPDDVRAAAAAGVVPLGLAAEGEGPAREALWSAGAARVVASLAEIEELLP